jgi:hypothetical protein
MGEWEEVCDVRGMGRGGGGVFPRAGEGISAPRARARAATHPHVARHHGRRAAGGRGQGGVGRGGHGQALHLGERRARAVARKDLRLQDAVVAGSQRHAARGSAHQGLQASGTAEHGQRGAKGGCTEGRGPLDPRVWRVARGQFHRPPLQNLNHHLLPSRARRRIAIRPARPLARLRTSPPSFPLLT